MFDNTTKHARQWVSVAATHAGVVRKINEDAVLSLPEAGLWTVADGMGGYDAGEIASNLIVSTLAANTYNASSFQQLIDSVENSLADANRRILDYSATRLDGQTLGSTVVSLIIKNDAGACLWAGDSRLYHYRENRLMQISRDHSQVEELVAEGIISRAEARNHPRANIITRAVGTNRDVAIDIKVFSVQHDDIFLLCSDGLYNMLSDDEIAGIISSHPADKAVARLLQQSLEYGANDNVSVVLVKADAVA